MFNKLKAKKPPLSLSQVSNVIKTSGSKELSPEEIKAKYIKLSTIAQAGLPPNSILAIGFDPVQSLLAVSTKTNEVRVFGQQSVEVVIEFSSTSPITHLRFVKGIYLVAISASIGSIIILSLKSKQILGKYSVQGGIISIETDPSLDWLILGLSNGSLFFYDIDRLSITPYRIDNLQKKILPKIKMSSVLDIKWHPRDLGTIMVTYSHSVIIYSLSSGQIKNSFIYQLSKGDKGFDTAMAIDSNGKKSLFGSPKEVIPELIQSHFHPNGLHIVTVHKDNSLVFWDATTGTLLEARNIFDINLHKPGPPIVLSENFTPITSVKWICGSDPEYTQLVISGGDVKANNLLHVLDFGYTLKYSLTSHEKQGEFYANPQSGQRILPVTLNDSKTPGTEIITEIFPLPNENQPYFSGTHDPTHLLLLSNIGAIYIVEFSSIGGAQGSSDFSDLLIPPSLSSVIPPVKFSKIQSVKRIEWYSIMSSRVNSGSTARVKQLLRGGEPAQRRNTPRPIGFNADYRSILITGHEKGLVRLLDISRGEHQEPERIVQISLKDTLYDFGNPQSLKVLNVSCAFESRELIVALANGDVVLCKFGKVNGISSQGSFTNKSYSDCDTLHSNGDAKIIDLSERISRSFASSTNFLPVGLIELNQREPITALKHSDIGFAAIGYKSGKLIVTDVTRGPAIIFNSNINDLLISQTSSCYITSIEFAIQEYGQDGYSSILLYVGTNNGGNLMIFKVIPLGNGGYDVVFTDKSIGLNYKHNGSEGESKIDQIIPIGSTDGISSIASLDKFNKLSQGIVVPGYIITTSTRDIRVLKVPKVKLAHRVIEDTCLCCGVINYQNQGVVLCILTKSGYLRFCSLPSLKEICDTQIPTELFKKIQATLNRAESGDADVLWDGELFIRTCQSEFYHLYIHNSDSKKSVDTSVTDILFNENAIIPPRPTAGALSWAKGQTGYVTSKDLSLLIAGPNRKEPKFEESRLAYNISPEANPNQSFGAYATPTSNDRGYKPPVRKATAGSTGSLGTPGFMRSFREGLESVEETFNSYANTASESMTQTIEDQKKSMYSAAFKQKFGF
ncbi:lethal giant larvae like, C-terminal-domain-containing protein [Scheffersomyces amazonensis]|uniref:lethal giant larvae like, C-terminal-domain-containing protein n=1 Tax=Scheffersomyces amazonensis TaxID=1078765 RepID=UPI00315D3A89